MDNKCAVSHIMEHYFTLKGNEFLNMLKRGGTLETWSEEASHKRPHIVWCHLFEMSRIGNSIKQYGFRTGEASE